MGGENSLADDLRALDRRRLIEALLPLRKQGKSLSECAGLIGKPAATLWRLEKAWQRGGEAALKTRHANAGRPRLASPEMFSEDAVNFCKRIYLKTESLPLALEQLSDAGPCSPEARDLIDRYRESRAYPDSFYRLFHITQEEWDLYRGKKHFEGATHTARRGMFYLDQFGKRIELLSGGLVEADDVSTDTPYFVQLPDGSYSVGRQCLVFRDRRSRKWLGAYAVARERDSYRAEDIARVCRELVEAWGLVDRMRFELGSWASQVIEGITVPDGKGGEMKWGGITSIIPVDHVRTSGGKGTIEGGFRMMHKVMGLHGVRIGKTRGEYEKPTADMMAVNEGRIKDPRTCGFIPFADVLGAFDKTFTLLNGRLVHFQELGCKLAPDDVWTQDMATRPGGHLPACPSDLLWHFLPIKREVGASLAQAGHVKVSVEGYPLPFFFRLGGVGLVYAGAGIPAEGIERQMPFIERGHRLIVAFDPQRAAEGAVIFNAERGPKNTQGWRPFQKLMLAPLASEAPQFSLMPKGSSRDAADIAARRVRDSQVRSAFSSIGIYGQGARHTRQDHDGQGNVARVESGAPARSRVPTAPAETPARTAPAAKSSRLSAVVSVEDFSAPPSRVAVHATPPAVEQW